MPSIKPSTEMELARSNVRCFAAVEIWVQQKEAGGHHLNAFERKQMQMALLLGDDMRKRIDTLLATRGKE